MQPTIERALREGWRAATRSGPGILVFVAAWTVALLVLVGGLLAMNPPAEFLEESDTATVAIGTDTAEVAQDTAGDAGQPAAPSARERITGEWVSGHWPGLSLLALLLLGFNVWMTGGQTGYVAGQVRARAAPAADIWRIGSQVFPRLFGAQVLGLAILAGALLAGVAAIALLGAVANALPAGLQAVSAVLMIGVLGGALVWLGVRAAFWFIAVVVEGKGPAAGLARSFRVTRGRWWQVAILGVVIGVLSYAGLVPSIVLDAIGTRLGGAGGNALGAVAGLLAAGVNVYMGFFGLGAMIRYYLDATDTARVSPGPS